MDNFTFIEKENYNIICRHKYLDQTIEVIFMPFANKDWLNKKCWWGVTAVIYNKRKHKNRLLENIESSGKIGISGLITIKNIILSFMEYIKIKNKDEINYIVIQGSDSRRFRIYKKSLIKYGFTYGELAGWNCMYKKVQ